LSSCFTGVIVCRVAIRLYIIVGQAEITCKSAAIYSMLDIIVMVAWHGVHRSARHATIRELPACYFPGRP